MVSRQGVPVARLAAFAASGCGNWPEHYVLRGPIVLNKIHIDGRDAAETMTEVGGQAHAFQEDFRQDDGRPHVQVHPTAFESPDQRREQQEVAVARSAQGTCVEGGMIVDDVRADGLVNGDGDCALVGRSHQAPFPKSSAPVTVEERSYCFPNPDASLITPLDGVMDIPAGLFRDAEQAW